MAGIRAATFTFALLLLAICDAWAAPRVPKAGRPVVTTTTASPAAKLGRSAQDLRSVATSEKLVAITLDDGPDPKYTPTALRIAREHGVHFTFFLLGSHVEAHPDLAREILAEGHAIGNHTWSHRVMMGLTETENRAEIECCQRALERTCGATPKLLRPPKGRFDDTAAKVADTLGYQIVLWSVAVENHTTKTPEAMTERVLSRVKPGAIILAHDGRPRDLINRDRTMKALEILVTELQKRGYKLVTVPELLAHASRQQAAPTPRNR